MESGPPPVRARRGLERLSLDDLDVGEFSQVVHNAFAGLTWFELLNVLDGKAPNTTHRTLAALVRSGAIHAIVTTNFDTLLERVVPPGFSTFNALLDDPPDPSTAALVKLHGTAGQPHSLVDLAAQKRQGIGPVWRSWLKSLLSWHPVLVLGFSGADLDVADDYLGLLEAAGHTPWLGWNARPAVALHPRAAEVLAISGECGHIIEGDLPNVLGSVGIPLTMAKPSKGNVESRVVEAVDRWLAQDGVDSAVCGIALERLLDAAGSHGPAEALRSALRTRTRRALREGLALGAATRAALVLGQLGIDDEQPARAMKDLDLAERALRAVVGHLRRIDGGLEPLGEIEYARNMSNIAHRRAVLLIRGGDADGAEREIARAWTYLESLPGDQRADRLPAHWQNTGAVAWLRGDRDRARALFEEARRAAERVGDIGFMRATEQILESMRSADEDARPASHL